MDNKDKQPNKDTNSLRDSVLKRIDNEAITPRSRFYWIFQEYGVWTLWALTVLFGALAVAVIEFSSLNSSYALYEATHESFLTFAIEALPYLWLLVFMLLVCVAYFNLRRTKQGYKYPFSHIVFSSLGFSLVGGILLHFAGVGFYLDTYLGRMSAMYESQAEMEMRLWQNPLAGRLVGNYQEDQTIFIDNNNHAWQLTTKELRMREQDLLLSGSRVRLIGLPDRDELNTFYVCAVFPWMLAKPPKLKDLQEERGEFMDRIRETRREIRIATSTSVNDYCQKLQIFERVKLR
jgi:heme/copper-type cytochrome/quinol oxidase subunit 2